MIGISKSFQEVFVAADATTVFWWAGSFTFNADGVFGLRIRFNDSLEQDLVLPVVTEIVGVSEGNLLAVLGNDVAHLDLL